MVGKRYQLLEELARGGMGVVYRALDTYAERELALKRLAVANEARRARLTQLFQNEYDTLATLAHPRIVEVHEYGVDQQGAYYTMELLSGGDLSRSLPLSVAETCRLLRDVASALALVHARGLVYRDLSPSNVRLTNEGNAKLIDFGALTPFGVAREIVGTAALMAPECLRRERLDPRTDLYALGALAYWCLTSVHAVRATGVADLADALQYPIEPPSSRVPGIPPALDELLLSLLSHEAIARPASAAEVMDRLTAIGGLPAEPEAERVAASYLMHPPLVGREQAMTQLVQRLELAAQGRGAALRIEGARGLGRTALVAQFTRHAQLRGTSVLRTQSSAQGSPLGVVRPLLRAALTAEPSLVQAHPLAAQLCAQEEAAPTLPRTAGEGAEHEARLFASIQECLLEFSRRTPTLLAVDDVHRADLESLGLLVALAHAAPAHALLVVLTSASDELPSHAHAFARLSDASASIDLVPIDVEQLTALTTSIFGAVPNNRRLAMWLHQRGAGNPARCLSLARVLLERGAIQYMTGTFSLPYDVPEETLGDALEHALPTQGRKPSTGAHGAAELLSVHDEAVTLDTLAQTTQLPRRELALALEELTKLALVRQDVDGRFAFTDESLRISFAEALPAERARALHLRVAHTLLALPEPSVDERVQAAHHLLRSDQTEEGLTLLNDLAPALSRSPEALSRAVPVLEQALTLHAARRSSDTYLAPLLIPLSLAGYYRDPKLLRRYVGQTLANLLHFTGGTLARRMRRWLGGKLAFVLGLVYARSRYAFATNLRNIPFRDLFTALFGVAGTCAAASCAAFDFTFAYAMGEALAPFAALGPKHAANIVREFCLTTASSRMGPLAPAERRFDALTELLSRPRSIASLDEEVRVQVLLGALYAGGMLKLLRAATDGLAIADHMDAQERAFYRPHAELLRMLHYAMRGEQHLAEPHRARTELLALLGGSGWSAVNNTAHRSILVYQWTQDSINLQRVVADLKRFAPLNAAVEPHIQLAEAYVELLRGRAVQAVALYEQTFARYPDLCSWTLPGERGRYAEALNASGKHGEARRVCKQALAELDPAERAYPFIVHVLEQQLALAEAQLGDTESAAARLETLLEQAEASGNPLLLGCLHRDRALVATIARDSAAFERHAAAMWRLFRATKNPALIQQCERCGTEGFKAGLNVPWSSTVQLLDPMFSARGANDAAGAPDVTAFVSEADVPPHGSRG
jgi:Protein kinase domain/AAA ATPase domain